MTNTLNFFIIILMMFIIPENTYCKPEKLKYFLVKSEITEIVPVDILHLNTDNSWMIKAFGNELIIDMYTYFPREDAYILYISKLRNASGTFLSSDISLHHGFVRGVNESFALGYFLNKNQFRGYVGTDEVYCIEPYESKVIVYRFKDIIVPGCQGENLDCIETKYFQPWKHNKPPPKPKGEKYSLFQDKHLDFYNQLVEKYISKKIDNKSYKKEQKIKTKDDQRVQFSRHDDKNKEEIYTSIFKEIIDALPSAFRKDHLDKSKQASQDENKDRSADKEKHAKDISNTSRNKTDDKNEVHSKGKSKDSKERKRNHHGKGHNKKETDDDDELFSIQENLKSHVHLPDSKGNLIFSKHNNRLENESQSVFNPISLEEINEIWKQYPYIADEKQTYKYVENNEVHPRALKQDDKTLNLQCGIEIVTSPTYVEKFAGNSEHMLKEIYMQITLLNKIFWKVPLTRKNSPFRLIFSIEQITEYSDLVYSPFSGDNNVEYFAKSHRQVGSSCLTIGFVNEFLRSGQFFDGYIPQGGGGVCANMGNNVVVSHGNDNTPTPMGLFFASLMRAVTRGFGANDEDSKCDNGSYPNPMLVLQEYILGKEIQPKNDYSIFTKCNIKEIDSMLMNRGCLEKVPNPLCGNGIVDEGEACDCGPAFHCERIDPCCTPPVARPSLQKQKESKFQGCVLKKGAECGSLDECCVNCHFNKVKGRCYSGTGACDIAHCDGKSGKCPSGPKASEGLICSKFNESNPLAEPLMCKDGNCNKPLCSSFGLKPCSCLPGSGQDCVYCCLSKDGKCKSAGKELQLVKGMDYLMENGMECMGGICMNGKCIPDSRQQLINFTNIVKPPRYPAVKSTGQGCHRMNAVFLALFVACLLIK